MPHASSFAEEGEKGRLPLIVTSSMLVQNRHSIKFAIYGMLGMAIFFDGLDALTSSLELWQRMLVLVGLLLFVWAAFCLLDHAYDNWHGGAWHAFSAWWHQHTEWAEVRGTLHPPLPQSPPPTLESPPPPPPVYQNRARVVYAPVPLAPPPPPPDPPARTYPRALES